jgi:hypothetical protein
MKKRSSVEAIELFMVTSVGEIVKEVIKGGVVSSNRAVCARRERKKQKKMKREDGKKGWFLIDAKEWNGL